MSPMLMLRGISGRFMFFTAETARAGAADRPPYQNKTIWKTPLKRLRVEFLWDYSTLLSAHVFDLSLPTVPVFLHVSRLKLNNFFSASDRDEDIKNVQSLWSDKEASRPW